MRDEHAQGQTFSLANMMPQTAQLNRGIWKGVESAVRHLAEREGEFDVVTGPAFHGDQLSSIRPDGVLVPTSTWKAVYDPRAGGAGVYVCKNTDHPTCDTVSMGGFRRSSQRSGDGSDGGSAAFGSGSAGEGEVTWASGGGAAGGPAAVLGVDRRWFVERGRGDGGWDLAAGRVAVVPGWRRAGTVAPVPVVEAAFGTLPVVCRAGGDRCAAGAGPWRA